MDDEERRNESDSLCKLLLIGDGKVGKTHYAGMAAACGLNVLYFDGDVGRPTLRTLPKEVRSRIYSLDCADTLMAGQKDSSSSSLASSGGTIRRADWPSATILRAMCSGKSSPPR
jgi:hypothetical protein